MIDTKRKTAAKYGRLLDQLQILEYIETNNRPLHATRTRDAARLREAG